MSKRIKTNTEITDKELAIEALNQAEIVYQIKGDTIYMDSGELMHTSLSLKTGEISGDSDFGHTSENLGLLRKYYSEAKFKRECLKNGTLIDERQVNEEGDIVLMWHMA